MIGILLTNLGTPEAPTAPALRKYLAQFLSDPRVVTLPRLLWLPILYGPILTFRPKKSAEKYAKIWTTEGSPLKVNTERQAKLVKGLLGMQRQDLRVAWGMRYGQPSIASQLDSLVSQGALRVVVLPLYPQYAASTTESTQDAVTAWRKKNPNTPVMLISNYHDHPAYIGALAASVRAHWEKAGQAEKLVMSFHGVPQQVVDQGDPYADQCKHTGKLLAAELGLNENQWKLTFQSRFGPAKWLQPYTQQTLEAMGREGVASVDVICPGFSSDCLETLEEISMEVREAFLECGGKQFAYIPCLNDQPAHIAALAEILKPSL